jgi:flagellar hook protein FlgE
MNLVLFILAFTLTLTLTNCGMDKGFEPYSISVLDTTVNRNLRIQGNIISTGYILDLAIDGSGFFPLIHDTQTIFLRCPGNFFLDQDGYVVREFGGPRLLGWKLDSTGKHDSILSPICINKSKLRSEAKATSVITLQGNLGTESLPDRNRQVLSGQDYLKSLQKQDSSYISGRLEEIRISEFTTLSKKLTHSTDIVTYDATGEPHFITMYFESADTLLPKFWKWEFVSGDDAEIVGGESGTISFNFDGSPSAFLFNDSTRKKIKVKPKNCSAIYEISIEWGAPGSFLGLTQFDSYTTAAFIGQDGHAVGTFEELEIDEFGTFYGAFSNGVYKELWRIPLCEIPCVEGLWFIGYDYYIPTKKSGIPEYVDLKMNTISKFLPGAIEDPM